MPEGPEIAESDPARTPGAEERAAEHQATAGRASDALRQLTLPDVLALAILAAGLVLRLWPLGGGATDYDEGVYWQSLRAMALGHPLFGSVFSSQPPLFLLAIYPFYLLFGQSLLAARLAIVLYALAGLVAIYVAGRAIGGRWVGLAALALLASDPLIVQESHTLQAETPAIAFSLAAVALAALAARGAPPRRRGLAAGSGLALALGVGTKLFAVVTLVPIALYLLAPLGAALVDPTGRLLWPGRAPALRALREGTPDLLACAAAALAGAAVVFLPFAGVWPSLYSQSVRFHLAAASTFNFGLRANVQAILQLQGELPLELATAVVVAIALVRRHWAVVPVALWTVAALVLIVRLHPLAQHDIAVLIPTLALTTAAGLPAVVDALAEWAPSLRAPWALPAGGERPGSLPALALLAVLVIFGIGVSTVQVGSAAAPPSGAAVAATALDAVTSPGDLVVADDQYVAALAGRDVPPQLVDTSLVRIESGYLTAGQLEAAVQQPQVRAVLFYSGRFNLVPGFHAWVAAHYFLVGSFGDDTALYVKIPPTPLPA